MAPLYTPSKTEQTPDYTRSSRGILPDRSAGILVSGLASMADEGISGVDELQKQDISKELYEGLNTNRDKDILNSASTLANKTQEVPTDISSSMTALQTNKNRKEAGKMSDADYWLRAKDIASSLRARYPGYREYIDQTTNSILGTNPANRARDLLRQAIEAQESGKDDLAKERRAWIKQNEEWIAPLFPNFIGNEDNYDFNYVRNEVAKYKGQKTQYMMEKEAVDSGIRMGKPIDAPTVLHQTFTNELGLAVSTKINSAIHTLGFKSYEDFEQRLLDIRTGRGKPSTPQEIQAYEAIATNMEQSIRMEAMKLGNQNIGGRSVRSIVGAEKLDKTTEDSIKVIKELKTSLINKETGLVGMFVRHEQYKNDRLKADIVEKFPWMRGIPVLREMGGSQAMDTLLRGTNLNSRLGEVGKYILQGSVISNGTGTVPGETLSTTADKYRRLGLKVDGNSMGELARVTHKGITTPEIPDDVKTNLSNTVYRDNQIFRNTRAGERLPFLRKFASPQMTEEQYRLGKADPTIWGNYKKWVSDAVQVTFSTTAANLQSQQRGGWLSEKSPLRLEFDPETGKVGISDRPIPKYLDNAEGRNLIRLTRTALQNQVNTLNEALGIVSNVFSKDKEPVSPVLLQQLQRMGVQTKDQPFFAPPAKRSEGPTDTSSQTASVSPTEGRTEGVGEARAMLASFNPNAPAGSPGAPRGIPEGAMSFAPAELPKGKLQMTSNVDFKHVSAETKGVIQDAVKEGLPVQLISGYRSPSYNSRVGGARRSQHTHGKAFDVDLKNLSEEERRNVINHFLDDPRVGGFGYYPKSNTIHVDTRDNKAAWGSNRSHTSIGKGWPSWMTERVNDWLANKSSRGTSGATDISSQSRMNPMQRSSGMDTMELSRISREAMSRAGANVRAKDMKLNQGLDYPSDLGGAGPSVRELMNQRLPVN